MFQYQISSEAVESIRSLAASRYTYFPCLGFIKLLFWVYMQSTSVVMSGNFFKPSRNIFFRIYKCIAMEGNAFLIVKVVL